MTIFYHVPGPTYRAGEDLLCWQQLEEYGVVSEADWKWERDEDGPIYVDTDVVCLYETRDEAAVHVETYSPDAPTFILRVDVPADAHITYVLEGFPAVIGRVPAEWITIEQL